METHIDPQVTPAKPRIRVKATSRAAMMLAGGHTSYSGASQVNSNIALWRPPLKSADADLKGDAEKLRARARDLRRNHPYAQQAVRASRLGVIGKKLRYSCRPDHRFLGIDFDVALRWGQEFERIWEAYAHGHGHGRSFQIDAARRRNFTQFMSLAHDSVFTDGEALVTGEWNPRRAWKTCFQQVDVDRLSNPNGRPENDTLKGGIELDEYGAPIGYHIRDGHPVEAGLISTRSMSWSRVSRETSWGRPVALHVFEAERPGQTRGVTAFASVIAAMKMGAEYTETALQQAILQASYAAVLTSQQNYKDALELIQGMDPTEGASMTDMAEENLAAALEHHERIKLKFNGAQIPVLWPGEDLKMVTPGTGAAAIGEFQGEATRSYAAGTGTDPIQVSQNYEKINYSSAKMAAATSFRHYEVRRELLTSNIAFPMVASFLEEAVFSGGMDLPRGISPLDFYDALPALIRGVFLTQGAPMLDPVKERQGQKLALELGTGTLQDFAAEEGEDYLDKLDQQQREQIERSRRGLGAVAAGPAPAGLPDPDLDPDSDGDENSENNEKTVH